MPKILPSTELRNNFNSVEKLAQETRQPIYLTKNGRGSLVVMDIDAFEEYQIEQAYRRYLDTALAQAECNRLDGDSKYHDMETAFIELLDEDVAGVADEALDATA